MKQTVKIGETYFHDVHGKVEIAHDPKFGAVAIRKPEWSFHTVRYVMVHELKSHMKTALEEFLINNSLDKHGEAFISCIDARKYAELYHSEKLTQMAGSEILSFSEWFESPLANDLPQTIIGHGKAYYEYIAPKIAALKSELVVASKHIGFEQKMVQTKQNTINWQRDKIDQLRAENDRTREALVKYQNATDELYGMSQEVRDTIVKHIGTLHQPESLSSLPQDSGDKNEQTPKA